MPVGGWRFNDILKVEAESRCFKRTLMYRKVQWVGQTIVLSRIFNHKPMAGESVCGGAFGLSERRARRDSTAHSQQSDKVSSFGFLQYIAYTALAMFKARDLRHASCRFNSCEVTAEVRPALAIANNEPSRSQLRR